MNLVNYRIYTGEKPGLASMYDYVLAGNGIFIEAKKPGMEARIHWSGVPSPVRGLPALHPSLRLFSRVSSQFLSTMLRISLDAMPNEALFWLHPFQQERPWRMVIPEQMQSPGGVRPVDPYHPIYGRLYIEVHSHHTMAPFFSATDDRDEIGFKIYAVIGRLDTRPAILCRVGIYGHYQEIPASWVFEIPAGIEDELEARYAGR